MKTLSFNWGTLRVPNRDPERGAGSRGKCGQRNYLVQAYLLTEALVYIGLVFVLLGVAYVGLYRFIDNSVVLSRNAQDVSRAVHAGERWRQDVRLARAGVQIESSTEGQILHLDRQRGEISYTFREGTVWRRIDRGPWVKLLKDVKSSSMEADVRPHVTAWRWELELQPRTKGAIKAGRVRPLFTFLAVPPIRSDS